MPFDCFCYSYDFGELLLTSVYVVLSLFVPFISLTVFSVAFLRVSFSTAWKAYDDRHYSDFCFFSVLASHFCDIAVSVTLYIEILSVILIAHAVYI